MIRFGYLIAAAVIVLDQVTKYWIVYEVMSPPRVIEVTGFFNIVMVWNRGASFGLFGSSGGWGPLVLGALALAICAALSVWLSRTTDRWLGTAIGLVIGGALGNVIDRLVHRAVADFLDFHVFGYHWPSFNVADMAISVGVVLLLLDGLIGGRRHHKLQE